MATLLHIFRIRFLLVELVLLCYFSHVAASGVETSFDVHKSIKCIDHEREALLQFKQHTKDHCGLLTSWGQQEDCCLWHGLRCSNLTGHVTELHLRGEDNCPCLEGKVVSPLFELKHLIYMDLSSNVISHTIPNSIDSMTNLKHLNLSFGTFYGEVPPQLGNLSSLAYLNLGYNNFHSTKSLCWLMGLTSLREIHLSELNLSEAANWFETIKKIRSLRVLYLDYCQLPTKIPSSLSYMNLSATLRAVSLSSNNFNDTSIYQWLFNLSRAGHQFEYLDLSGNFLSGPLPSEFGNMHSLKYLSLSRNELGGLIPDIFSNMRSLKVLSLSDNNFHGPISKVLKKLCHLKEIDLSSNDLTDDFSRIIEALSSGCSSTPVLESLDLSGNRLWGSILDTINKFSKLREIHLNENNLNGTISEDIGKLSMLEVLDISNNRFEATINHNHFLNLTRLRQLDLSSNPALAVKVKVDWIPPFKLDSINLGSCKLGPTFPLWIINQTNLWNLDLSNSQISSNIPDAFWIEILSHDQLNLNVSHNMIHGVLPNFSTTLNVQYFEIDLSSNYFQGSIPSFLGLYAMSLHLNNNMFTQSFHLLCPNTTNSVIGLQSIDLSNNLLSGEIPDCWMHFDKLSAVHLENNNFFGNIPTSFGALKQLQYLHLENNSLTGGIPVSLENCTSLHILDLEHNLLNGSIPSNLGHALKDLAILNLRGNDFFGTLPSSLCQLSKLRILDLSSNRVSGMIPNCIQNLTSMMNDQVDDEDYYDTFHYFTNFSNDGVGMVDETAAIEWKREERRFGSSLILVKAIYLSCNELEGRIPDGISSLGGLVSLDLSRNKLSGSIPTNIGQLNSLEFLDLSNNQLFGTIPTSLAQVSTLEILDLSNNNLSGKIPLGTQLQGFDPSSYKGNTLLCGMPLQECPGDDEPPPSTIEGENITQHEHVYDDIFPRLYISVILGFIFGFWGVCGTLVLKRSWRVAFFQFLDDMKDKLNVFPWKKT